MCRARQEKSCPDATTMDPDGFWVRHNEWDGSPGPQRPKSVTKRLLRICYQLDTTKEKRRNKDGQTDKL